MSRRSRGVGDILISALLGSRRVAARLLAVAKWAVVLSITVGGQRVVRVVTGVLHIRAVLGSTASGQRVEEFLLLHLLRRGLQRGPARLFGRPDSSVGCQYRMIATHKRQNKPVRVLLIERRRKGKQRVTKVNSVAAQRRSSSNILEHGIILGHKRRVSRLRTRRSNRKVIASFSQRRRNRGSLENRRRESVKGSPVQHGVPCVVGRHLAIIHVGAVSNGKRIIGARLGSIVDTRVIIECRKVQERRVCVKVSTGLGEVHFIVLDDLEVRSGLVHHFAWADSRRNKLLRKVKGEHLNFGGFRLGDGPSLNICITQRPGVSVGIGA